ncbi:MAG: O-antigen ligase family protein [Candidatus Limnocylindrales bacterium]
MHGLERIQGSARLAGLTDLRGRELARVVAAASAALVVLGAFAFNQNAPYDIHAGIPARIVAGLAPLVAAAVAGYAVLRPWPAFLAILLLTPVFDVPQVWLNVGPIQVIAQTLFVGVLGLGLALRPRAPGTQGVLTAPAAGTPPAPQSVAPQSVAAQSVAPQSAAALAQPAARGFRRANLRLDYVAGAAVVALLVLASLSTAVSPDRVTSATILLHGILEPAAMGFILLALRPTGRQLAVALVVLAVSVSLGGLIDMVQTIPAMGTLEAMQANRLLFSRINYFNVGLFGEMLAMAMPVLLAVLLAHRRRYIRLNRAAIALIVAAIVVALASLFLTFSKSAYLATFGGCLVLVLLVIRTWRRRVTLVLAVTLISAAVIPWPAFFLQVAPPLEQAYRSAMVSLMGESRYDSWNPSTISGTGSLLERWYATRAALEMAVDHPILGIGLDQFKTQYVPGRYKPPEARLNLDWAHSMLPEVAAELGLPALVLEVLVYAAAFLALWRVYRAPPDGQTRLMACVLLAALVSWQLVGTAFAGDMYRPWRNMSSDYVMMAVLMASAFALYRQVRRGAAS